MPNTDNVIHKGTAEILVNNQKFCFSTLFGRIKLHCMNNSCDHNYVLLQIKSECTLGQSFLHHKKLIHVSVSLSKIIIINHADHTLLEKVLTSTFNIFYYHAQKMKPSLSMHSLFWLVQSFFSKDAVIFHSSTLDRPKIIENLVSDCSTSLKSRKSTETGFFTTENEIFMLNEYIFFTSAFYTFEHTLNCPIRSRGTSN